jgi:hypothetical protein
MYIYTCVLSSIYLRGHLGRDRMVVGFTTTYAFSAYHHWRCEFESRSGRGVQHYVIKFVSNLRQVNGFPVSSTNNNRPPQYNWNIVESGINTIKPNQIYIFDLFYHTLNFFCRISACRGREYLGRRWVKNKCSGHFTKDCWIRCR